jgi:hypothetical protein
MKKVALIFSDLRLIPRKHESGWKGAEQVLQFLRVRVVLEARTCRLSIEVTTVSSIGVGDEGAQSTTDT